MNRREFFSLAAAAAAAPKAGHSEPIKTLGEQIEEAILRDMPDVTSVKITYDPADQRMPLIVVAMRG